MLIYKVSSKHIALKGQRFSFTALNSVSPEESKTRFEKKEKKNRDEMKEEEEEEEAVEGEEGSH